MSKKVTFIKPMLNSSPMVSDLDIQELIRIRSLERKDDPDRQQGMHGPYEEIVLLKTGRLPEDYYEDFDDDPWGLLMGESRSNILWQVTSGIMDRYPEFAGAYMSLALDHSLEEAEYTRELSGVHKDWRKYIESAGLLNDHKHQSMGHIYHSVACPACSVLTTMASRDQGMISLFKEMLGFKPQDRNVFLKEKGLLPYLDIMIPKDSILMPTSAEPKIN